MRLDIAIVALSVMFGWIGVFLIGAIYGRNHPLPATVFYGSNIKACNGGATDVPCVDGKPAHAGNITDPTPCVESGPPNEWHCYPPAALQVIDARDPLITALGKAIANEEGWNVPTSLARILKNPGMLVWAGQVGGSFIGSSPYAAFSSEDAGWSALYADLRAKWFHDHIICLTVGLKQDACAVYAIAYYWSTGDGEKYAADIVADLKRGGFLK